MMIGELIIVDPSISYTSDVLVVNIIINYISLHHGPGTPLALHEHAKLHEASRMRGQQGRLMQQVIHVANICCEHGGFHREPADKPGHLGSQMD